MNSFTLFAIISSAVLIASGIAQCPEKFGRFPVTGQCDAYIECTDGEAEEKLCPDGLVFNDQVSPIGFPCQYPIDVSCEGRPNLQPPQSTPDCPRQYGYHRLGDASNCGKFKHCAAGTAFVFDCPTGLAFDERKYRCDWADQVDDCNAESYLGFTCPEAGRSEFQGTDDIRYFRSTANCQEYFVCIGGRPRMYTCSEDYAFNDLTQSCDGIENVTGCAL